MNDVWQWFLENWALIRTVVSVVVGLLLWVFVRHQGKLKEVALLVWAAVWELAKEGQASVTREMVDIVAETVWAWLKDSNWGTWLDRFGITEKMVANAAWKLWLLFEDAMFAEGVTSEYHAYEYHAYLDAVQAAKSRLAARGLIARQVEPFSTRHLS